VGKTEQLAQDRKQFKGDREVPGSSGAVVDKRVFDIFELAKCLLQEIRDLTA
jgi:hypothetical protein